MNSYLVAAIAAGALLVVRFLIPAIYSERTNAMTPPLTIGRIALAVFLGNLLTAAVVAALYFLFTAR